MRDDASMALTVRGRALALVIAAGGLIGAAVWPVARAAETAPAAADVAPVEAKQDPALVEAVRAASAAAVAAFDANDPAAVAGLFAEQGELIDENGTVHSGRPAIEAVFARFFEAFPGAQLLMEVQDVRRVDDGIAIEEGVRLVLTADSAAAAQVRYAAVRMRKDGGWPIVSYREFADDPPPTAREMLGQLEWLVGEWIDESPEGRTVIAYRWSDDGSYLIGEFNLSIGGQPTSTSLQRIGWDPVALTLRSWTFDADGGFGEGIWTPTESGWLVKSVATLPDGSTGSATLSLVPASADQMVIRGVDRVVAGMNEPDFELRIARRQPRPDDVGAADGGDAGEATADPARDAATR